MTSELLTTENTAAMEDDMSQFLREIREYPLLSPEEERLLPGAALRAMRKPFARW